jgi:SAM-dependent methyltransferase
VHDGERQRWEARHRAATHESLPSPFVVAALDLVAPADGAPAPRGRALDVACGSGRHARLLATHGYRVEAIDVALTALQRLRRSAAGLAIACVAADVTVSPLPHARYAVVVVTDFLVRQLFPALRDAVAPGGVLVLETFLRGHERYGPPRNPDHLLTPGELRDACTGWTVLAGYEGETQGAGRAALRAGIVARKPPVVDTPDRLRSTLAP